MNPPSTSYTNLLQDQSNLMPANGWVWARAISWNTPNIRLSFENFTNGMKAHNSVVRNGTATSMLMPVKNGDEISKLYVDPGFSDVLYRFYPAN